jgi:hypothetical protein
MKASWATAAKDDEEACGPGEAVTLGVFAKDAGE